MPDDVVEIGVRMVTEMGTDLGLEVVDEFLDLCSAVSGAVIGHSSDGQRVKPHRLCTIST